MSIRPNKLKRKLADGKTACVISGLNGADGIDQFGTAGFDGVWLEGEHGPVDFADIADLTRACDLLTEAASAGVDNSPIGACKIGHSRFSRSVSAF